MKFTSEQLAKAKAAKSAEELLALSEENGLKLSEEEAEKLFARWHKEGALADEELDNVSGGCGEDPTPDPRYQVGQHLWIGFPTTRNYAEVRVDAAEFYVKGDGWRYLVTMVDYGFQSNYYLETHSYVLDYDPGSAWIFK